MKQHPQTVRFSKDQLELIQQFVTLKGVAKNAVICEAVSIGLQVMLSQAACEKAQEADVIAPPPTCVTPSEDGPVRLFVYDDLEI